MIDVILDTILDGIKLIPFLFIAFLIIEIFEHKINGKKIITSSGKFGPVVGALLGAFPQCGFSVLATNLYTTRIITMGTLISIYLSTSDEMLPILISEQVDIKFIITIIIIKVIVGIIAGFVIDLIIRKKRIR
ncbi:MAG: putative manganese transporter [Bacilli bacterium]